MKNKLVFGLLSSLLLFPLTVCALDEVVEEQIEQVEEVEEVEQVEEIEEIEELIETEPTTDDTEEIEDEIVDDNTELDENSNYVEEPNLNTATEEPPAENEVHKVSVIIKKEDHHGNPLAGATLQILDADGNIIEEWVTDGTDHKTLLPEGEYTLHEVIAPEGYVLAEDKTFIVEVVINNVTAGVIHDDSPEVCWHYLGVPLFYIENEDGEREEVYCINQNWEEPHDVEYDGQVLTPENILIYIPDADPEMTGEEIYDKVLDIIYHRNSAEEEYSDLSQTEIRMITEYAIKNYTSTQFSNGTWARGTSYDRDSEKGYVSDPGNGTTLGRLAYHWWTAHGHTKLPDIYADFYYYLIRDNDHHPSDMHLYLYSTQATTDEGPYQNLLGVRPYNPYDENQVVEVVMVNNPETGDEITTYFAMSFVGIFSLFGGVFFLKKEF